MTNAYAGLLGGSSYSTSTAAYPLYQRLLKSGQQDYTTFTSSTAVQANVDYLKKTLPTIQSPSDLTKNPKLLGIVLTAFGLQSDQQYPARVLGVLKSDLSDETSLANQLIDPRYKQLAQFFNFNVYQGKNLSLASFAQDLSDKYTQGAYEASLGDQNQALRSASYFEQNIGKVTSAYDILGDSVLREVVTTALKLPANIAVLPVEDQANLITQKLDITKFQNAGAASATAAQLSTADSDLAALGKLTTAVSSTLDPVQSIADRAKALLDGYSQLAGITSTAGPNAAEIPVQQAAVPGLARQQGLLSAAGQATDAITGLTQTLASAVAQAQAGGLSPTDLATLQSRFANTVGQANTLTQQATYGGANLLDGSIAQPISVALTSAGQASVVNPYDFGSGVLDSLASADAAFQSGDYAGASTFLLTAQASLAVATQQQGIDSDNFRAGLATVPQWATTEDEANLYAATETVQSGETAAGDANSLVQQIRSLARQAASSGLPDGDPGLQDLDTQYRDLLQQLQGTITGAAYSGQNLLDGSSVLIGSSTTAGQVALGNVQRQDGTTTPPAQLAVDGVNLLQFANGGAGGADDLFNLDLTTGAGAQSVIDKIDTVVDPAVQRAFRVLGADTSAFGLVSQIDPRAALDDQYRQLASDVADQVATATDTTGSLISPTATDQTLSVGTTGGFLIAHANAGFSSQVADALTAGSQALTGNFTTALQSLNDAAFFSTETADSLRADQTALNLQNSLVTNFKSAAPASTPSSDFAPFNSTNTFVQQFVAKYLVLSDSAGQSASSGATSWQLSLFA